MKRMKIEEEKADLAYNGLQLGPQKIVEQIASNPTLAAKEVTEPKQTTLNLGTPKVEVAQARNSS